MWSSRTSLKCSLLYFSIFAVFDSLQKCPISAQYSKFERVNACMISFLSVCPIDLESLLNTLSWEAALLQRLAICLLNVSKLSMSIPKRVIQGSLFKVLSPINSRSFTN